MSADTREKKLETNIAIADNSQIEELADELASDYSKYFSIDLTLEKRRLEESVEECLTHLEEVRDVLDDYKQNCSDGSEVMDQITSKNDQLNELFNQIDSLETYILDTNKTLDELENKMKDLENRKKLGSNKIIQVIDLAKRYCKIND